MVPGRTKHTRWWIGVVGLLALAGCKVTAPVQLPAPMHPPASFTGSPVGEGTAAANDSSSLGDLRWSSFFADPQLRSLLDTVLRQNPDGLAALQRVEAARSAVLASRAALLPSLDAVASAGVDKYGDYTMNGVGNYDTNLSENIRPNQRIPNPTPDYFIGLRSAWEIDVWGKLRSQKKAAYARLLATQQGSRLVTTSLVAQTASLYYQLLALDNELAILRKNISLQEIALETIKIQKLGGRATELAVQQFEAQLLRTQSMLAAKQQQITATENQINLLAGRFPQPVRRGSPMLEQQLPRAISAGLPSALLRRRPDIQQAELQLAAARADADAARAAFFPSLRITPYLGLNAFNASLLLNPGSVAYGALAGLSAPLLNRKGLRGNYNRLVARNLGGYYNYQKAVLTGFREVVTNLRQIENLKRTYALQEERAAVLQSAVTTANDLFVTGYASYLEVITAQRSVLEAELELNDTRKQQFLAVIDLYRALGGGWQ